MRKISIALLTFVIVLSSCTYREKEKNRTEFSVGFLRINEPEQIKTLFPPSTRDYISSQVISQIHLGLFRYYSKSLSIVSGIADD